MQKRRRIAVERLLRGGAGYLHQPPPFDELALDEGLELRWAVADGLGTLLGKFRLYLARAQRIDGRAVDPVDNLRRGFRRRKQTVPEPDLVARQALGDGGHIRQQRRSHRGGDAERP